MNMRKIAGITAAVIMTGTMAATAYAADYAVKPDYQLPAQTTAKPSETTAAAEQEEKLPPAGTSLKNPLELITKDYVAKALENDEPVYASYNDCEIKSNAVAVLARKEGGRLTVVTKRYTAAVNANSVTEAKDISLAINMTKNSRKGALIMSTEQQGSFGCTVEITVKPYYYEQAGVDLSKAHVYCIDPDTNEVIDMGAVKLDKDSNIVFSMTKGGKYIVL